ncbi:MAG: hypothetical protein KAG84_00830 [Bacteroidales bacterium]|nr:hypothetical protein [Bacteroidales bacterium]
MTLRLKLIILLIFPVLSIIAQPGNYWSMGSNTEASILAGAVVGGGSGITSIFYNPAGISELDQNKISIDASLFQFNLSNYKNAYRETEDESFLDYQALPRFFSFVYHSKSVPKLSFQYSVFSRGQHLSKLNGNGSRNVIEEYTNNEKEYSVNYTYENRFTDTWFGIGTSYKINDHWIIGYSLLGSIKTLLYYENTGVDLLPINDSITEVSKYLYYDRQDLYVVSVINKFGAHYKTGDWSFGLNITTPSIRIYGDGYHRREVSMTNIILKDGPVDDFVEKETNYHLRSNFKEPLSIAFGVQRSISKHNINLYFTTEYFFEIDDYKSIDNSKIANFYSDEYKPGSEFLSFQYGAHDVLNIAVGFKKNIHEKLALMVGFKTDFSTYQVSKYDQVEYGQYIRGYSDLYYLTTGVRFDFKKANVLFGLQYSYGKRKDQYQFRNYNYPGVYDKGNYYALQDYPEDKMEYTNNGLGIYLGLGFNF